MKTLHMIAFALLVIGGLNWLLVAFNFNLVQTVFGTWPAVVTLIYVLVGLSAILEAVTHGKNCKMCTAGGMK